LFKLFSGYLNYCGTAWTR